MNLPQFVTAIVLLAIVARLIKADRQIVLIVLSPLLLIILIAIVKVIGG
jgi:hypothetical protein